MTRWLEPYLTVPFRDRGRDGAGWDCWGAVTMVYRERAKIDLEPFADISPSDGERIERAITAEAENWIEAEFGKEQELDVVVMRDVYLCGKEALSADMHVGVIVAPGRMFHVERKIGGSVVHLSHPSVKSRLQRLYRHKALA